MNRIGFFLLLITTGLCSAKWFQINSTCFQVSQTLVNHDAAIRSCQEKGAILHSIQNMAEFGSLRPLLTGNWYKVSAKRTASGFKWGDGRDCCPGSWWRDGAPRARGNCAVLHINSNDIRLYVVNCYTKYKFICSKPAVAKWTLVKCEEYYWPDLCGVAIMPNCDGRSCEEVCDSHPDCNQFAKISNLCIDIKNDAPLNECVIKMSQNVEFYKRSKSEFYCKL